MDGAVTRLLICCGLLNNTTQVDATVITPTCLVCGQIQTFYTIARFSCEGLLHGLILLGRSVASISTGESAQKIQLLIEVAAA